MAQTKKKVKIRKDVAYRDGTIAIEDLPYPTVHYPGHYGTFFAFQKKKGSKLYLCSCCKKAVKNYMKDRRQNEIPRYADPTREFILDSMHFPLKLVKELMKKKFNNDKDVFEALNFKEGLCHECNKIVPSYTYCHPMYGAAFKQNFGWYINKQRFRYGVWCKGVKTKRPAELEKLYAQALKALKSLERARDRWEKEHPNQYHYPESLEKKSKEYDKRALPLAHYIENTVRDKFGCPRVGEGWISETILFKTIKRLFPKQHVIHHYKPKFLKGLEIDIFIKNLNIAIEYQGQQHFNPVGHWGGEEGLKKLQERDKIKKKLCADKGTPLIYFYHDENISDEIVMSKLKKFIDHHR